jgi:hypothetical protein
LNEIIRNINTLKPLTGPGHGLQGVDKFPGEETSQDKDEFTQESQKGKGVDADVDKESDKTAKQNDL